MHRRGRSSIPNARPGRDDSKRWLLVEEINLISGNASVVWLRQDPDNNWIDRGWNEPSTSPTSRLSLLLRYLTYISTVQIIVNLVYRVQFVPLFRQKVFYRLSAPSINICSFHNALAILIVSTTSRFWKWAMIDISSVLRVVFLRFPCFTMLFFFIGQFWEHW